MAAPVLPPVPRTAIIYSELSPSASAELARACGLDLKQTLLLTDRDGSVSHDRYGVDPCPRVFVLDAAGMLVYTNDHADDRPREAPAALITAKALDALRAAPQPPPPLPPPSPPPTKHARATSTGERNDCP